MSGIRYKALNKGKGVKGIDSWTYTNIDTNKNINPYEVSKICGINSNLYVGSDVMYNSDSRSLLRQYNINNIPPKFSHMFLTNVSD